MQNILPKNILLSLYNTLILPHINYCTILGEKKRFYIIITKRALRAIASTGYRAHSEPLFKIYNVLMGAGMMNYKKY